MDMDSATKVSAEMNNNLFTEATTETNVYLY